MITRIPLRPDPRHPDGYHKYVSDFVIRTDSRHQGRVTRFGVGYVAPDEEYRREYQGPLLTGPYAYLYPLPVVIDKHGGTGAESQRLRAQGLEADIPLGSIVEINGHQYRLTDDRWGHNPALTPID